MVKHGRSKKRRAGRIGRTKLKNKTFTRWNPNPRFGDQRIKVLWDVSKSPSANMAAMGLVAHPNEDVVQRNGPHTQEPDVLPGAIELFDIPDSDNLADQKKKRQPRPLSKDDQEYIAKCMAKHGDDYGKMFRDIKVNNMQHTETQLRKLGSRFLLLTPEQLVVDVPDRMKM